MISLNRDTNNLKNKSQEEKCYYCNDCLHKVDTIIENDIALECPICESIYVKIDNNIRLVKKSEKIIIKEKIKNLKNHIKNIKILMVCSLVVAVVVNLILLIFY